MVIFMGIPCTNCPTSVSSILPRKMRSFMLATLAMVVPSLNVLLRMTELPTFTGMSSMMPLMVERTSVLEALALLFDTPSRITCRLSSAAAFSCWACCSAWRFFSNSSALTSSFLNSSSSRWKSILACARLI